ncbi:MAG TPA: hypothetical protein VMH00_06680 [Candidatus Limnocylindrales bacterium]|nr:hypothetical protein [Candidatus Limnocylindrales bacterium]
MLARSTPALRKLNTGAEFERLLRQASETQKAGPEIVKEAARDSKRSFAVQKRSQQRRLF